MTRVSGMRLSRVAVDAVSLLAWTTFFGMLTVLNVYLGWGNRLVTDAALATVLQVMPAIIIALYAAAFGSLFVIAQIIAPNRGARSVRMLILERRLRAMVAGTVLVTVLAVFIAGQIPPDNQDKNVVPGLLGTAASSWAAALGETIIVIILAFTVVLGQLFHFYSSLTDFSARVVGLARRRPRYLEEASKVLRQWLCTAARDGSSRDLKWACQAALELMDLYLKQDEPFRETPPSRCVEGEAGVLSVNISAMPGWFSDLLGRSLVRAIEEAARADGAYRNLDHLLETHAAITGKVIHGLAIDGLDADGKMLVRGLVEIGYLLNQADSERLQTWFKTRPVEKLVALDCLVHERSAASASEASSLAVLHEGILAGWCHLMAIGQAQASPTCGQGCTHPTLHGNHSNVLWEGAAEAMKNWCTAPSWSLYGGHSEDALIEAGRTHAAPRSVDGHSIHNHSAFSVAATLAWLSGPLKHR
jgi:hypothetical protein